MHAIVVGAGFGGIAAALRLRAKGYQVTLIDRCNHIGGRARVFEREGFRHDAGPTVITAPFLFEELFALFNEKFSDHVRLVPLTPWYRFAFRDGSRFDYGGTLEQTLAEIRRIEPRDVGGYLALLRHSQRIFDVGKDIASHMACGGKIKNIQFLRAYDQNTVLATRISFEKLKDFPVVFKCRQKDDKTLFLDFLPGQDPTRHADSKVIEPFLKHWETAWNSGAPDGLLQQMHSFGKIQRDLNDKRVPKTFIDKQFQMLYQELGRIRSHVVKDFKARTNEYLVAFTYESGQTILAAINLQKDHDGEWRIFSFDLDDGDRALRTPDSWNPQ